MDQIMREVSHENQRVIYVVPQDIYTLIHILKQPDSVSYNGGDAGLEYLMREAKTYIIQIETSRVQEMVIANEWKQFLIDRILENDDPNPDYVPYDIQKDDDFQSFCTLMCLKAIYNIELSRKLKEDATFHIGILNSLMNEERDEIMLTQQIQIPLEIATEETYLDYGVLIRYTSTLTEDKETK